MGRQRAKRRIKTCIKYNKKFLDLSDMKLTEIPDNLPDCIETLICRYNNLSKLPDTLPRFLKHLDCSNTTLKEIPSTLPDSIRRLICSNNQLTKLPDKLPSELRNLICHRNNIIKLPDKLPDFLEELYCIDNMLTALPDNFPLTIRKVQCQFNNIRYLPASLNPPGIYTIYHSNRWLHISPEYVSQRTYVRVTPDYTKCANIIIKKWKECRRIKRLKFCKKLEEHATEFLLRPGNYFYALVKEQNKDLFIT